MTVNDVQDNTKKTNFSLSNNPFYLLKTTPTDSIETLTDQYEDLMYEGGNEQALTKLYQSLCASISRLIYETSWCLDITNEEIRKYINDPSAPIDDSLPTLTKINLLANSLNQQIRDELLTAWFESWEQLSEEETLTLILKQREQSGFPAITAEQLSSALTQLKTQQVSAIIYDVNSLHNVYDWLLLQISKDSDKPLLTGTILSELVNCADSVSISKLEHIKEQMMALLSQIFNAPSEQREPLLEPLKETVEQWSYYTKIMDSARKRRGLQEQVKTVDLLSEVTKFVSEKVYGHNLEDTAEHFNNLVYAIKTLKPIREKVVHNDSTLFEGLNDIINQYEYRHDYLVFTREFTELNAVYTQVKEKADDFLQQAAHQNFKEKTSDSTQNCLANEFHHTLIETLEKTESQEKRDLIFNTILFFIWGVDKEVLMRNVYGVIAYIEEIRSLTKTYLVDNTPDHKETIDFINQTEGLAIDYFISFYLDANDANTLAYFFKNILPRIQENTEYVNDIKELQKLVTKAQASESTAGISSVLNFIIIIIVVISFVAQCAGR